MKFKRLQNEVVAGNVYPAKGGSRRGSKGPTRWWLVASVTENGAYCHLIGLNDELEIVSTTSYGCHVLERRTLAGRCVGFNKLNLRIDFL